MYNILVIKQVFSYEIPKSTRKYCRLYNLQSVLSKESGRGLWSVSRLNCLALRYCEAALDAQRQGLTGF